MSDLTPKPIVAPPGVAATLPVTATAASPATATAAEIPAAIANLSVGSVVTGVVIERAARGLVLLRTDKGTIKFQSPLPLRQGSTVTLQIQSVGAQVQLSILSIDGQPLAPSKLAGPDAAAGHAAASPSQAARAGTTAAENLTAHASPSDRATPRPAMAAAFVARPLIGHTVSAGLEALSAQRAQETAPGTAAAAGAGTANAGTTGLRVGDRVVASLLAAAEPPAAGGALPRAGTAPAAPAPGSVILRLVGLEPPPATPAAAGARLASGAASPTAQTLVGTIMPSSGGVPSATLISTPLGVLSWPGTPPFPVGSRVLLEVLPPAELPASGVHRPELAQPPSGATAARAPEWPMMREIMNAVASADPALAQHLANVTLPRVGPNLAAGLLAFVAAVRQGNPRAWLGEQTIEALHRGGQGALINQLSDEFLALSRTAADTSPGGWQTLLVPLFDGERIQQIHMYMRRARRKAGERGGTRFMLEADLTRLGRVQLDGLISKPQFDLVVRSQAELLPEMRGDIIEIFGDALLATHLKGQVIFQVSAELRSGPPGGDGEADDGEPGAGLVV